MELDPHGTAVKVDFEIEEIDCQLHVGLIEGRADAEAGDAVMAFAIHHAAHGVDAMFRHQEIGQRHIGGGIAEFAAPFVAMLDNADDLPGPPENAVGLRYLAGRSEEHPSELQSLMRISYAVLCLK